MAPKKKAPTPVKEAAKKPAKPFVQAPEETGHGFEDEVQPAREKLKLKQDVTRTPLNHASDNSVSIDGLQFRRSGSALDQSDKKTLDVNKDLLNPELSYRWVNEEKGLVDKRREMGYQTVSELKGKMGEQITTRRRVGSNKDGSDLFAVLMATPKKWKDEREDAQEAQRRSQVDGMSAGKSDGKGDLGKDFYVKDNHKIN